MYFVLFDNNKDRLILDFASGSLRILRKVITPGPANSDIVTITNIRNILQYTVLKYALGTKVANVPSGPHHRIFHLSTVLYQRFGLEFINFAQAARARRKPSS